MFTPNKLSTPQNIGVSQANDSSGVTLSCRSNSTYVSPLAGQHAPAPTDTLFTPPHVPVHITVSIATPRKQGYDLDQVWVYECSSQQDWTVKITQAPMKLNPSSDSTPSLLHFYFTPESCGTYRLEFHQRGVERVGAPVRVVVGLERTKQILFGSPAPKPSFSSLTPPPSSASKLNLFQSARSLLNFSPSSANLTAPSHLSFNDSLPELDSAVSRRLNALEQRLRNLIMEKQAQESKKRNFDIDLMKEFGSVLKEIEGSPTPSIQPRSSPNHLQVNSIAEKDISDDEDSTDDEFEPTTVYSTPPRQRAGGEKGLLRLRPSTTQQAREGQERESLVKQENEREEGKTKEDLERESEEQKFHELITELNFIIMSRWQCHKDNMLDNRSTKGSRIEVRPGDKLGHAVLSVKINKSDRDAIEAAMFGRPPPLEEVQTVASIFNQPEVTVTRTVKREASVLPSVKPESKGDSAATSASVPSSPPSSSFSRVFFFSGAALAVLAGMAQILIRRMGFSGDVSDYAMDLLFAGCFALVAWASKCIVECVASIKSQWKGFVDQCESSLQTREWRFSNVEYTLNELWRDQYVQLEERMMNKIQSEGLVRYFMVLCVALLLHITLVVMSAKDKAKNGVSSSSAAFFESVALRLMLTASLVLVLYVIKLCSDVSLIMFKQQDLVARIHHKITEVFAIEASRIRSSRQLRANDEMLTFQMSHSLYQVDKNDTEFYMSTLERGFTLPLFGFQASIQRPLLFKACTACWALLMFVWKIPLMPSGTDNAAVSLPTQDTLPLALLYVFWPLPVLLTTLLRFVKYEKRPRI